MTTDKNLLQENFLNKIRKDRISVTVFLVNGVKLQGMISAFDNFSIMLRRDHHAQLVYKHAISTIMPAMPINLDPNADDGIDEVVDEDSEAEADHNDDDAGGEE